MAQIAERYAGAVHASTLTTDPRTTMSNTDVLGAYGLADKYLTRGHDGQGNQYRPAPLAVPLERLFTGDNRAAHEIVRILEEMAWKKARTMRVKPFGHAVAHDMACSCLAWCRNGTCRACGGHGKVIIKESHALSNQDCPECYDQRSQTSTGRIPFEKHFRQDWHELARWLVAQITMDSERAGQAAMRAIAPSLNL